MKKYLYIGTVGLLGLALVLIVGLYFSGTIRINYPDTDEFPISGIDVSHHQGDIDWENMKDDGLTFVYMKATEGGDFKDPKFPHNWKESEKAGLFRGAYHFFTFCRSGKEQAQNFIQSVPVEKNTLPPAITLEFVGNCKARPSKSELLKELGEFTDSVDKTYGQRPVLYVTYRSYEKILMGEMISLRIWIRDIFGRPRLPDYQAWMFWQYTDKGSLSGIHGFVDLNVFNGTRQQFHRLMKKEDGYQLTKADPLSPRLRRTGPAFAESFRLRHSYGGTSRRHQNSSVALLY